MPVRLTQSYVNSIKPDPDKPRWITDAVAQNLKLYVGTSGTKVWYVYYRENGRKASHKLGPAGEVLTVAMARDMANDFLAQIAKGENPKKKKNQRIRLGDFLTDVYAPWVIVNRKSGTETVKMLHAAFGFLFNRNIEDLKIIEIEKWRMERLGSGSKASTINRLVAALHSALNWAVKRNIIETNPLQRLESLQEHDSDVMVRYLTDEERKRLMDALDAREKRMREERESYNKWLRERGKEPMPALSGEYADHLKPMVLLSLHTGIRQNNLFSLRWGDVDFEGRAITLRAAVSKSGKTLRLPINRVAVAVFSAWRDQSANVADDALVFPSPKTGGKFDNCVRAWERLMKGAKIENFRWHDMRHDFASQLVMRGIDLNTVRELMGHASLTMTLRYAHLAPKDKLRAAEVLAEI